MGALRIAILAHLRHRRLQAAVIGLVLLLSTASAALALNDALESQAPFEHAFAAANGAHIVLNLEPWVTDAQIRATTTASGVTDSAGPWLTGPVGLSSETVGPGLVLRTPLELVMASARDDPAASVDRMTISTGRWWRAPGEVVVSQAWAERHQVTIGTLVPAQEVPLPDKGGGKVVVPPSSSTLPTRTLTVVGIAGSISTPRVAAWMSATDLEALTAPLTRSLQVLYRVSPAATPGDLGTAIAAITRSLPTGAVDAADTYLSLRQDVDKTAAVFVPILLAFSVFGLLAAAFLIANAVSGIVLASYRQIGIMKAVGYTPMGIAAVLLGEILAPAALGTALGLAAGTVASLPILDQAARSFGLPGATGISIPLVAALGLVTLGIAALAALGPALRAGRLSAVEALTRGSMPSQSHRSGWGARLPLPTPVVRGLTAATAHPLRTAMTVGALTVGVAAVLFAVGLNASLHAVAEDLVRDQASPVRIDLRGASEDAATVTSAIAGSPDTGHWVAIGTEQVTTPRLGRIPFVAYEGDASWIGYRLISGRWFAGPGEAVAPTNTFRTSGLAVGEQTTISLNGRSVTVTLVGEIFDQAGEGSDDLVLRGTWADLAQLDPQLTPDQWEVQPVDGVSPSEYRASLALPLDLADISIVRSSDRSESFLLFEGAAWLIGLVLLVVSIGGVLITVLLETRHRALEIAIFKTLGMTPRQVMAMVIAWVLPAGLVAGAVGVPVGLVCQHVVLGFMGDAASHTRIPDSVFAVFSPAALAGLGALGVLIGAAGALLPARQAAAARIAPVLQAE